MATHMQADSWGNQQKQFRKMVTATEHNIFIDIVKIKRIALPIQQIIEFQENSDFASLAVGPLSPKE